MSRVAVVALILIAGAGGCGSESTEAGDGEVVVSAAASLEPAFTAYAEAAELEAKQSFAGSDDLAAQIRRGVRPDVYAAADTRLPAELHAEGLVEAPVTFATNELVLAVPADGGAAIRSLADLGREGISIAIGDDGAPVGDYAREALAGLDRADREAVLANVRSLEPDVAGIVGKLAQGAVDAGFVYASDVAAAGGALEAVELPPGLRPEIVYSAAVVEGAANEAGARRFVAGLRRGAGPGTLRAAGFGLPPR